MLSAGAGCPVNIDAKIALVHIDIDLLGLRQHRDRYCRGMNTSLAFRRRHALHPMNAGFVFQAGKDVTASDFRDAFLHTAEFGVAKFHDLEFPAAPFRVFLVHLEQFGSE